MRQDPRGNGARVEVLTLAREPGGVRDARLFVRAQAGAAPEDVVEDAVLLVSELVTNALLHTTHGPIRVAVDDGAGRLSVGVTDDSPQVPSSTPSVGLVSFGRGVPLLDALSQEWWVEPRPEGGKTVWCRLAW